MTTPSNNNKFKYVLFRVEDRYANVGDTRHKIIHITDNEEEARKVARQNVKTCTEHGITCGVDIFKYDVDEIVKELRFLEYEEERINTIYDNSALLKDEELLKEIIGMLSFNHIDFYEDNYEHIGPDEIILYYEHQTFMNYAFNILDIKRAKDAGVSSVKDLPPHVDRCYRPYAMVVTNEELLAAYNRETKDYVLSRINKGFGIIKQWLIDEGIIQEDIQEEQEE